MDNRLQYISEHLEEMKLGLDDTFKFHCDQCGKCCINRDDILLNPKDVYNISKELHLTPQEFIKQYCEVYVGHDSRMPIVRLRPRGMIQRCPLLKDRKCSVHKVKPTVCAMYPLGRYVAIDSETFESGTVDGTAVGYIINPIICGDHSETHVVRDWLTAFNIPLQDESYVQWNRAISAIGSKLKKLGTLCDEGCMHVIYNFSCFALYVNYDLSQDYLPQFNSNWQRLQTCLQRFIEDGEKDA